MENVSTVSTPKIKKKVLVNIAKNLRPAECLPQYRTCESQDQVQAYNREYPENQEIKMTLSMMPSLCRVQAVLTLVLTIIACQVDISLSHLLFCVGNFSTAGALVVITV